MLMRLGSLFKCSLFIGNVRNQCHCIAKLALNSLKTSKTFLVPAMLNFPTLSSLNLADFISTCH